MPDMKSNEQTQSIYCKDCDYVHLRPVGGYFCQQYQDHLRSYRERLVEHPVKCHECATFGVRQMCD